MKGRIWLFVIVLCVLLLPGPVPARGPVEARVEQQAVPENFYALGTDSGDDYVESDAALTAQGSIAAAADVQAPAASDCAHKYYTTIHSSDIDGDGLDELLARTRSGMEVWRFEAASKRWTRVVSEGPFSDADGWDLEPYYATIHSADIDGDGLDELLGRGVDGMQAYRFNGTGWDLLASAGPFSNADGWDEAKYYATIHSADIDGDGVDELLGRGADGMQAWRFNGTAWDLIASGGPFSDSAGWTDAMYYATIHSGDIDGNGLDELLGRHADGMQAWRFNGTSWELVASGGPFQVLTRGGNYDGYYYEGPGRWMGYVYPDWMAGIPDGAKWFVGDYNSDGRDDLAGAFDDDGQISIDVHSSTGTAFGFERWATQQGDWLSGMQWFLA